MAMPPTLRWALMRLPVRAEEQVRLKREQRESQAFLTRMERVLVAVDASPAGLLASRLVGVLAGLRRIPTTILHLGSAAQDAEHLRREAARSAAMLQAGVDAGDQSAVTVADKADVLSRAEAEPNADEAIAAEARKGYGLLVLGREPCATGTAFDDEVTRNVTDFAGPFALTIARGAHRQPDSQPALQILVAVTGTRSSLQGAEVAIALAHASRGSLTALTVNCARPRCAGASASGAPSRPRPARSPPCARSKVSVSTMAWG